MHILMTTDTVGGVWTYSVTLSRALQALDVDVTLAILGPAPSPSQLDELRVLRKIVWCHHPGRLEWMPGGLDDLGSSGEWLLSIADASRPDVVHLNGYGHAACPFGKPLVVVAHSCVCSWWRAVKGESIPARLGGYRAMVARGLAHADVVIAPTRAMRDALADEYGFRGPAQVIPNGCDLEGAVVKEPLIFAAGRFDDDAKNLELLERAAGALAWPVVVAGESGSRQPRGVTCLGRVDRATVASWLARAAIYALPARYEPFGLSILEAARLRCALVVGDIPSLREVWGEAAAYVDPDSHDELAACVNRLAANAKYRRHMANAARHRSDRYSSYASAAAYHRAYQTLAGAASRRSMLVPQVH